MAALPLGSLLEEGIFHMHVGKVMPQHVDALLGSLVTLHRQPLRVEEDTDMGGRAMLNKPEHRRGTVVNVVGVYLHEEPHAVPSRLLGKAAEEIALLGEEIVEAGRPPMVAGHNVVDVLGEIFLRRRRIVVVDAAHSDASASRLADEFKDFANISDVRSDVARGKHDADRRSLDPRTLPDGPKQ